MRKTKNIKRLFSAALSLCIVMGSLVIPGISAFAADADIAKAEELQQQYVSSATGAPVIGTVTHPASVGAFEMFEVKFDLQAEYVNPFDPDDITVNGVFTAPSGKKQIVPAFYIVPMESTSGKSLMSYSTGAYRAVEGEEAGWRVRFSGDEVGQYSFYIEVQDSQGRSAFSDPAVFNITASDNPGYVVVSKTNPEYFETSGNGSLFYGSGANIAWVRSAFTTDPTHMSYDYFLARAHEEGNNMIRVWMCHWAWLEWMPSATDTSTYSYAGLGYYNQNISAAFDRILSICEDYDLKVILTLEDNDEHRGNGSYGNWAYNPYNVVNGGPAADTTDYYANEEVREYYKKRIRYIVARWGYSTSLYSLNMWNDCSSTSNINVYHYLQELYDYKNSITENFRPLLMGSNYNDDVADTDGTVYEINDIFDYTTQCLNINDGSKPSVTQECFSSGIDDYKYFKVSLHDTVWSEFMRGSATTMVWSHDEVDETDSYDVFTNILKFVKDIPLNKSEYIYHSSDGEVSDMHLSIDTDPYKIVEALPLGDASEFGLKAPENQFYIDYNDSNLYLAGYNPQLYGNNSDRVIWKNPPTFNINAPNGGTVIFNASGGGSGTNILTATINGETSELGRWSSSLGNSAKYISVELQKGENTITLDNTGHDWLSVGRIYAIFNATQTQDIVKISTLRSENQTIAYAYNTTYNYLYNTLLGYENTPISDTEITLGGFNDSIYEVEMYNPTTGRFLYSIDSRATNGKLSVNIPKYESTDIPISMKLNACSETNTAISFKVDATGMGSALSIRGCISGNGYRNTGGSANYYLVAEDGTTTAYTFAGERFSIPQGFKGTVILPFDCFKGNGTMNAEDIFTLEQLPFSLYLYGTDTDTNELILSDISYMTGNSENGFVSGDTALELGSLDTLLAENKLSCWGALSKEDFSISDYEILLNIPYLEHDMAFRITEKAECRVQFRDPSGRIHETLYVDAGSTINTDDIPALPSRTGYTVTGWSSQVNSVITEDTVIWALYEKNSDYTFNVTSTNGTITYPGSKTAANFEDLITATAPAEENGIPFSHWEIDGVRVSASNPYYFRASGSVELTAVYSTDSEETPGVFLNTSAILTKVTDTTFKFSMIGQSYIPDGYTLVEAGMLLAAGDKSDDTFTIANKMATGKFSTVGNISPEDFVLSQQSLAMYKPAELESTESIGWQLEVAAPAGTDEAVSLYINAAAVTSDFTVVPFFKSGNNTMTCTPYTSVYLYSDGGSASKVTVGTSGNVPIPAGFSGEVIIPFNALNTTPDFEPTSFPLYSNLVFGITVKGLGNSEYICFNDLKFREIEDGAYFPVGEKQSPFFGYYEAVYQNFSNLTQETVDSYISTWENGGHTPTLSLTDNGRVSMTTSSEAHSYLAIYGSSAYDNSAKGVSMYIDLSSQTEARNLRLTIATTLADGSNVTYMPWYGKTCYYISDKDGTVVESTVSGSNQWSSWVSLPAGFVGKLFLPFDALTMPEDYSGEVDETYTHSPSESVGQQIRNLTLQFGNSDNLNDIIVVDDYCWLYDASSGFSPSPFGEGWTQKVAQDFTGATQETLSEYATVNSNSTITLTEDGRVSASREDTNALYLSAIPSTTFSADAKGISFHYDGTALTSNAIFRVYMYAKINGVTYNYMPWYSKTYYYLPDGEDAVVEKRTISGSGQWQSWLNATAGSSGTYFIPFDSMTPPEGVLDPTTGTNVAESFCRDYHDLIGQPISNIQIMQSGLSGVEITVDDFCWVYDSMFTSGRLEERFRSDFYVDSSVYKVAKVPVISAYENSQFMVSLTNVKMENIRSGRAYIIVRDNNDNLHTYYSNAVCVASWLDY